MSSSRKYQCQLFSDEVFVCVNYGSNVNISTLFLASVLTGTYVSNNILFFQFVAVTKYQYGIWIP